MSEAQVDAPVPVTVIGGYLGAGKTTLVNALLQRATDPFAVLVNDFGSINIDADLITADDGTTIALSNGCICCSLVDGFASALQRLRTVDPRPARVLVEASGVADPRQVAAYAHAPGFALDGIVVLVDGLDVDQQLQSELIADVVERQLVGADLLVMTKADVADPTRFERSRSTLARRLDAPVIVSSGGALPSAVVFSSKRLDQPVQQTAMTDDLFETWDEEQRAPLDRGELEERLDALPRHVVRAKGFVRFGDSPDFVHVVQVVGRRRSIVVHGPWQGQRLALVFIARKRSPEAHR